MLMPENCLFLFPHFVLEKRGDYH